MLTMEKPWYNVWAPSRGDESEAVPGFENDPGSVAASFVQKHHAWFGYRQKVRVYVRSLSSEKALMCFIVRAERVNGKIVFDAINVRTERVDGQVIFDPTYYFMDPTPDKSANISLEVCRRRFP